MIIVDSSVWIDYFRAIPTPQTLWLKGMEKEEVGIAALILCEVLRGARSQRDFVAVRNAMLSFPVLRGDEVALAIAAAENYRILRAKGITVRKTADTLIATLCIRGHHELLHNDRDFDAFEKHLCLRVIHP